MATEPRIRDFVANDLDAVWEMNEAAVDAVSSVSREQMSALVSMSRDVLVVEDGAELVGFCNTFDTGAGYNSVNYRWFSERYDAFVYLDRIVVADSHRNRGLGARLYEEVERRMIATGGPYLLTCEVNFDPPNEGSLRFHRRIGFGAVGHQESKPGLVVEMLAKLVSDHGD
jgi:predicted GNAT superfamily acetyltransferase